MLLSKSVTVRSHFSHNRELWVTNSTAQQISAVERTEQAEHFGSGLAVEVPGGLVAQQQPLSGEERAAHGDALLLSAAQVVPLAVLEPLQPHLHKQRAAVLEMVAWWFPIAQYQGHQHFLQRCERLYQVMELEEEHNRAAAQCCPPGVVHPAGGLTHQEHLPRRGLVQQADHVTQGALARAPTHPPVRRSRCVAGAGPVHAAPLTSGGLTGAS